MTNSQMSLVFLDSAHPGGRVADPAAPALSVTDLGPARGDGIFETLLAVGGAPRKLAAHLSRLGTSAEATQIRIPPRAAWEAAVGTGIQEFLRQHGAPESDRLAVRLVATRGDENGPRSEDGAPVPTCWVQVSASSLPVKEDAKPIRVLTLDRGYDSGAAARAPWLLLGAKTLSYAVNMAALRYAKDNGADDVIFLTSDGKVLEGPTSTVLLASVGADGTKTLTTPERKTGILPGTTQSAIFDLAEQAGWELGYGPLETDALFQADAVYLASSVRLLAQVEQIDGKRIGQDLDLTQKLTDELWDLAEKIG